MDKKKLIFCYVVQVLSVVTLFIMAMPIIKVSGASMSVMDAVIEVGDWVFMEEYLFGIAGLITIISLPILIITVEFCKLSACGVIKNRVVDLILYIANIVIIVLVVGVSVNYFLGLGRTIGMSGLKLFKGPTNFKNATPFFYLHVLFSVSMLVVAILNKPSKKA